MTFHILVHVYPLLTAKSVYIFNNCGHYILAAFKFSANKITLIITLSFFTTLCIQFSANRIRQVEVGDPVAFFATVTPHDIEHLVGHLESFIHTLFYYFTLELLLFKGGVHILYFSSFLSDVYIFTYLTLFCQKDMLPKYSRDMHAKGHKVRH